jgi:AcrR family transcriptional regulator
MSDIAARLGGSKGTLYNYFKGKDELFAACIEAECAGIAGPSGAGAGPRPPLDAALQSAGESLLARVCSRSWLISFQLVAPQARRAPELALRVDEAGAAPARRQIAQALADSGSVPASAVGEAVERFIGLCLGDLPMRLMLDLTSPPSPGQIQQRAAHAVSALLSVYGAGDESRPATDS